MLCEKNVLVPEERESYLSQKNYLNYCATGAVSLTRIRNCELSEQDFSVGVPLVTLASVLATTGLIRWRLAEALGWTVEELSEREKDPGRLTLAEIERVSELTLRPVGQLLLDLREEMRARTTIAQQAKQKPQRSHEGLLL